MTVALPAQTLPLHDALLDVFTSITQDCVLAGVQPLGLSLSHYATGFWHVSVQLADVEEVEALAAAWRCHPDDGKTSNYTRQGVIDVDGRTVTVTAYTGRPKHPAFPVGYAPAVVQS